MFETVSAFATVGLSMGITASLSGIGKGTLLLLMFLGRVGPLVFAAALARRQAGASQFRFAYEEVAIG
jgi:trk system potassium uptake protein TrkH